MRIKFILFVLTIFVPAVTFACDPREDGDCCTKAADCTAYVYEALCAVIPLNKVKAEILTKEKTPKLDFCTEDTVNRLRIDAKSKIVKCDQGSCEFVEDNG